MYSFCAALLASAALAPSADLRYYDDAALHAVQFVDRNEGWAVGDLGVIWHTIDSGKSWERQPSGVRGSLRAVHFLNPYTGWIVGREELAQGAGSAGVLLVTRDGGLKWQRVGVGLMPGLNAVRFFDDRNGLVLGDGSDSFPTGIFTTQDGGRSWKPQAGPRTPTWLAADFTADGRGGVLAGAWSRLATWRPDQLTAADVDTLGGRSLRGLKVNGSRAVAVGQGGLVLLSGSGGARWGFADLGLSPEALASCDFHGVHFLDNHIRIVGRPGSVCLHSADSGRTWNLYPTGQATPLNDVCFVDDATGWAVGELGTILGTRDGGKTWSVQQRGGSRAAALFVHARPDGLPLDTVALLGGEEGYLTAAIRVLGSDPATAAPARASEPAAWSAAMRQAGGAAGEMLWQFPFPQHLARADRVGLLQAWDRLHSEQASDLLLRQLVLALRIWRPEVVVTDLADAKTASPAEALVAEAVAEAMKRAADPAAFPDQLTKLGLKPWQAAKLYSRWSDGTGAQVALDLNEVRPRLESTLRDFAAPAAALLADEPVSLPAGRWFRYLAGQPADGRAHTDLMQGILLAQEGTARRKLADLTEPSPELVKAIRARRNLQLLATEPPGGLTDPERLLAQIGPELAKLPDEQAVAAAFAVASQFARQGQWTLAREAYLLMVDRYPAHPLSVEAYRWLVRHSSSSEARRRQELNQFLKVTELKPVKKEGPNPVVQVNHREGNFTITGLVDAREWYKGSLALQGRLAAFGPLVAADPGLQFCWQSSRRNLGEFDAAQKWLEQFRTQPASDLWRSAAAAERWVIDRSGPPPRPAILCRQTSRRPFLDAQFDDDCWQGLTPLALRPVVGDDLRDKDKPERVAADFGTEVRLAYDNEFLYLALRCQHPADLHVEPVKGRQRDADLQRFDRVSLLLDLDRDYSTCFHLQVDQRGCVCEDCWGDRRWNPRWFVAVHSEATCWQIEAAIPLTELTGEKVTVGRAWAANVVRILPGRGVLAMSLPADVEPRPEGLGLLLFTPDKPAQGTGARGQP